MSVNQIMTNKDSNQSVMSVLFNNGPTQAGVMVGIVNAISQPFSQNSVLKALHLIHWAESLPLIIALVVSLMLAVYQTLVMQKTRVTEALIVIPLVTGILFGMSLGANHLTADVINSSSVTYDNAKSDAMAQQKRKIQNQLDTLQKQIALLNQPSDSFSEMPAPKTREIANSIKLEAETDDDSFVQSTPVTRTPQSAKPNTARKHTLEQHTELLGKMIQDIEKQNKQSTKNKLYRTWGGP